MTTSTIGRPSAPILLAAAGGRQAQERVFTRFALGAADIDKVAREVGAHRVVAYEQRLGEFGQAIGYRRRRPVLSDTGILQRIAKDARGSAAGIVRTYNSDLRAFVNRQPKSLSQRDLTARVRDWKASRDRWKATQIALTEGQAGRAQAFDDFMTKNNLSPQRRARPAGAAEARCAAVVALGWMTAERAAGYALPLHPNCIHDWESREDPKALVGDRSRLWLGDMIRRRAPAARAAPAA